MRYRRSELSLSTLTVVMALVWITLIGFQLIRSMRIDAYELTQSRLDLIGYWVIFALSLILGLWLYKIRRLRLTPVLFVSILIIYITLVRLATASEQSVISFLFSRYGLVMWFVIGIGFAGVLDILQSISSRPAAKWVKTIILLIMAILSVPALSFALEIIKSPIVTLSYQSVANSLTIYLTIFYCCLVVLWRQSISFAIINIYFLMSSVLVLAVSLLQSTLIVAVWLVLIAVFISEKLEQGKFKPRLAATFVMIIGLMAYINLEILETFSNETRFSALFFNEGDFTSLTSRAGIVETFWEQYYISPIFGNFEAEKISGVGQGNYMHSLLLSFMTHTGIIGVVFVTLILILLIGNGGLKINKFNYSFVILKKFMILFIVLGCFSTFMTWSVFWFMLGSLCLYPKFIKERIKNDSYN